MAADVSRMKVMIVDQLDIMRGVIKGLLETLNVRHVTSAKSIADAWSQMRELPPDMLILDWTLADGLGIELVRKVRQASDSSNPYIPIIMLTGFNEAHYVQQAADEGVNAYVLKPISAPEFLHKVLYCATDPRDFVKQGDYFGPVRSSHPAVDMVPPAAAAHA
jgi:two-component system, chemotaxis family, chemotaxis protein CheY